MAIIEKAITEKMIIFAFGVNRRDLKMKWSSRFPTMMTPNHNVGNCAEEKSRGLVEAEAKASGARNASQEIVTYHMM